MNVAEVRIYPVKSLAGQSVRSAEVEPWGLRDDRRWAVLEADGTRISAREDHRLLGISARPTDTGVELSTRDGNSIVVRSPSDGDLVATTISRLDSMRVAGEEANAWLSGVLGRPVRLAWLDDPRRRSVSVAHGGQEGDPLTVADAGPLLLTSMSSLRQLNEWIGDGTMDMLRFRPNVVVDGAPEPFEEDRWRTLAVGDVPFRFAEICDRCVMTTLDPHTLQGGKEPLRTLARYRQWEHRTWFGVRIIPMATGTISVGDAIEVHTRA